MCVSRVSAVYRCVAGAYYCRRRHRAVATWPGIYTTYTLSEPMLTDRPSLQGQLTPTTNITSPKKDHHALPISPLEKMLQDSGPVRSDGSDKFFGMENVSYSPSTSITLTCRDTNSPRSIVWKHLVRPFRVSLF